ncbi:MAG: helix-turn-helix domain-containing protein, partial [Candidatus Nanopelagicales bacterium]
MSEDTGMTVGRMVSDARTAAGLTVPQVADATRIRATLVTAIEKDDFRLCGGDVYARGHLKSIATAVGLDPAEVVAQFDRDRGAQRPVSAPVEPVAGPISAASSGGSLGALAGPLGVSVESGRRGGGANWTAVMALALVVVIGVAVISALGNRGGNSPVAQPTPSTSTSSPAVSPSPSDSATEEPTPDQSTCPT